MAVWCSQRLSTVDALGGQVLLSCADAPSADNTRGCDAITKGVDALCDRAAISRRWFASSVVLKPGGVVSAGLGKARKFGPPVWMDAPAATRVLHSPVQVKSFAGSSFGSGVER